MQTSRKKNLLLYLLLHLAVSAAACLLVLLHRASQTIGRGLVLCFLHDVLHLYCPFCGGTRVLVSLLALDLPRAFMANPVLLMLLPLFLFFDLRISVRIARGDEHPLQVPSPVIFGSLAALFLYGAVRNVLLIAFHFDPLGDLLPYYQ